MGIFLCGGQYSPSQNQVFEEATLRTRKNAALNSLRFSDSPVDFKMSRADILKKFFQAKGFYRLAASNGRVSKLTAAGLLMEVCPAALR